MKNIIIVIFVVFSASVYPQNKELSKGLGFSAGMISGTGFSYRQINEKHGFQITFGIMSFSDDEDINEYYFSDGYNSTYNPNYWTPDTSGIKTEYEYGNAGNWGNLGFTYFMPLHRSTKSLFYMMTGISTYFSSDIKYSKDYRYIILSDSTYSYEPITEIKKTDNFDYELFLGIGIGIEDKHTDNIRLSIDLPLTFSNKGKITMLIPQAGIYYYFK